MTLKENPSLKPYLLEAIDIDYEDGLDLVNLAPICLTILLQIARER